MNIYHTVNEKKFFYDCEDFTFEAFYISLSEEKNHSYYQNTLHRHPNFYEFHYVIDGECEFEIYNNKKYRLRKNSFIIFPPNCQHRITYESSTFSKLAGLFSIKPKENTKNNFYRSFEVTANNIEIHKATKNLKFLVSLVSNFKNNKSRDYDNSLFFNYMSLIMEIFHITTGEKNIENKKIYSDKRINDAIKFIEDNISAELTVSDVSDYLHISGKQLTRLFRTYTGTTPGIFIKNERISILRRLLLNADYTLSDIAEIMQYNDVSALIKFFKNTEGITPQKYRGKFI